MSLSNIELVRRGFGRFATTGEILWDTLHDELEIHDHDIPERAEYSGHAGFNRWLSDWAEPWSDWSMDVKEVIDAGDKVVLVVRMRATGRASGVEVDRLDSLVYGFRDGKIARIDYFNSKEQGLAAAGLTPDMM